ncbi:alpha/beta hydrolase [Phenylobacterium immobile]|uniref:alpha/beta hydrolase n=1 Tax=Phenylobacterium immobile TaxID=21 RepID=UPI000A7C5BE7|nr:dienelactone hydrolase family protein [Phenylobacterium immobile]
MTFEPHPADGLGLRLGPPKGETLIVLLHGVGASGADLSPIAQALCAADPRRICVLLDGPEPFDGGGDGRQWFSVRGVTPDNRAERVTRALPRLVGRLEALLAAENLSWRSLTLLGFSQGAILTLGLAASGHSFGSGVALAGRLANSVETAHDGSPRLFISHGTADRVIPWAEGQDAQQRLAAAGFDARFQSVDGLGHQISGEQVETVQRWLSSAPCFGDRPEP